MLAGRMEELLGHRPNAAEVTPNGVGAELRKLYYDTASASSPGAMAALRIMAPPSHILFGTDYPFVKAAEGLSQLQQTPMPAAERQAMDRLNAVALIPRLAVLVNSLAVPTAMYGAGEPSTRESPDSQDGKTTCCIPDELVAMSAGLIMDGVRTRCAANRLELSAITRRVDSSAVFHEMASKGRSPLFSRLVGLTDIADRCSAEATAGEAFDLAFGVLKAAGRRDEYIYRSALTHNVLMGTHSLNTACMLAEFRAGSSKADLAILNGTATAYEIKSERDSLVRLRSQVENYKRVFAKVFVIASEGHVSGVLDTVPDDVGVMMLASRYRISTVRDAEDRPERICPATVFESLRVAEAAAILKSLAVKVPDVPNTKRYTVMRELFEDLDPAAVHVAMVKTLKRTRDLAPLSDLVDRLPRSLHAAALSIKVRRADHDRVVKAVSTPLSTAMGWV